MGTVGAAPSIPARTLRNNSWPGCAWPGVWRSCPARDSCSP